MKYSQVSVWPILCFLLLQACSTQPPAISERELQLVEGLPAMQKLYTATKRKVETLSGGARRITNNRLRELGERIADMHLVNLEETFNQDRQTYSGLVSLKNIAFYENVLKRIRSYKAAVTEVMTQVLMKERSTSEAFLAFFLDNFNETEEGQLQQLKRASLITHRSYDKHTQVTNLFGEMQLNLLLNAQQALENGAYGQAIFYADQARILADNDDVKAIVDRANAGLFNLRLVEPIKERKFEEAVAMLELFRREENFADLRPFLTRDVLQISAHYSKEAETFLKKKKFVEAFKSLRKVSEINNLVDRDMFNESFQISFLERLYNASRRAAQKNRSGLELGLLNAIHFLDAEYPGLDVSLAMATKRVQQQAVGRIAVLPFKGGAGLEELGEKTAQQLALQFTQYFSGRYQAIYVEDLENLKEARLGLDYYTTGKINKREVTLDKATGTSFETIGLAFSMVNAKTEVVFLQKEITARRPLVAASSDSKVTSVATTKTDNIDLNGEATTAGGPNPLLSQLSRQLAQEVGLEIRSPFQNYLASTMDRSEAGRELEAIESMAALVVLGDDKMVNESWREMLVEKSLHQVKRLNLR